jgi:helix-turn-helix protein
MNEHNEKLNLGKGSAFVKSRLSLSCPVLFTITETLARIEDQLAILTARFDERLPAIQTNLSAIVQRRPKKDSYSTEDVAGIVSRLIQESALQGSVSAPLRTQALLSPDTITSATERPSVTTPYLDAEGVAYLGITVSSLYGIVERGHLTPLRGPRRRYRFTKELLDDYLRRRAERR